MDVSSLALELPLLALTALRYSNRPLHHLQLHQAWTHHHRRLQVTKFDVVYHIKVALKKKRGGKGEGKEKGETRRSTVYAVAWRDV